MGKNNYILVILVILVLIFIVPNFMKKEDKKQSGSWGTAIPIGYIHDLANTQGCENDRWYESLSNLYCKGKCILWTSAMNECLNVKVESGRYAYILANTQSCPTSTLEWQCVYSLSCSGLSTQVCIINVGLTECAGTQTRTCNSGTWGSFGTCTKNDTNCGATCNTPADIQPCDNCVSTSELITFINKWTSGTETTSNLINVINAWTSGTC